VVWMLIVQAPRKLSDAKRVLTISVLPGVCYRAQDTVCLMASKVRSHLTAPYPTAPPRKAIAELFGMTPALQAASCTAMVRQRRAKAAFAAGQ